MTLVKFNREKPVGNSLIPSFDDIFESFFKDSLLGDRGISRVPAVNIWENENDYHFEVAAPGLKKEDFKLNLNRNLLTISVEQKMERRQEDRHVTREEYNYSSFTRSFALPESADDANISASYDNGVLSIQVPKREEAKSVMRQIEIK